MKSLVWLVMRQLALGRFCLEDAGEGVVIGCDVNVEVTQLNKGSLLGGWEFFSGGFQGSYNRNISRWGMIEIPTVRCCDLSLTSTSMSSIEESLRSTEKMSSLMNKATPPPCLFLSLKYSVFNIRYGLV